MHKHLIIARIREASSGRTDHVLEILDAVSTSKCDMFLQELLYLQFVPNEIRTTGETRASGIYNHQTATISFS